VKKKKKERRKEKLSHFPSILPPSIFATDFGLCPATLSFSGQVFKLNGGLDSKRVQQESGHTWQEKGPRFHGG
jgi:hypothetical protein